MNIKILTLVGCVVLFSFGAEAKWVSVFVEYNFGPEISEREACQRAERRAKEKALRSVTGERVSSEENLVCSEMGDTADCNLNRSTWSMVNGLIRAIKNKKIETLSGVAGYRKCKVFLEAEISVGIGEPDPSFDMQIQVNRSTFRHGEPMEISVSPSQPMNISVFQYLPYMQSDQQVMRIFPNPYDENGLFQDPGTIPSEQGRKLYDMTISFPEDRTITTNLIDEYLMIVGTRKPIRFLETYTLEEFSKTLLEIPRRDRRTVRRAYNIVRPQ